MSWLQFIDSLVGRLTWPIVVLIVLIAVRKHLGALAERILELSFGGATVKFDKLLKEGAEIIHEAPALPKPVGLPKIEPPCSSPLSSNFDIFDDEELGKVVSSFAVLERNLELVAEELGVKARNGTAVMRVLDKRGLISPEMVVLYNKLRQARNAAIRAPTTPTTASLDEYSRQVWYLVSEVRIAAAKLKAQKVKSRALAEGES